MARDWRGEKSAGQDSTGGDQAGAGGDGEENRAGGRPGSGPTASPRLPRRPAPGRDRADRHPRGNPGPGLVLAGSTADSALIRQVKSGMRDWSLGRVVWVADRGFTSKQNRKFLPSGGGARAAKGSGL